MINLQTALIFVLGLVVGAFALFTLGYNLFQQGEYIERLYYSLPGTSVGILALLWNIHNQDNIRIIQKKNDRRDYTLKAYDDFVAEPVKQALDEIDCLMTEIETAVHQKSMEGITTKSALTQIINESMMPKILKAYRLCREADSYMEKLKVKPSFEKKMYYISSDEKLDDLIINNLMDAQDSNRPEVIKFKKFRAIEKTITHKKAEMRGELTRKAHLINVRISK